jgi:hypothetical protein
VEIPVKSGGQLEGYRVNKIQEPDDGVLNPTQRVI